MKKTFLTGSLAGLFVMLFLAAAVSAEAPAIITHTTSSTTVYTNTSPTTVYTNTNWELKLTITDPDAGNTLTGYVQFYVNGVAKGTIQQQTVSNNISTLIGTLISSNFVKGNTLIAEYWASDGTNTIAKANTTAVVVQNSVPTISSGTITIDFDEDSDTSVVSASDLDSDSLTYSVITADSSLASCSMSGTTLTATRFNDTNKGTTTCTVIVNDGTATASAVFTITVNEKEESMLDIYDLDVYVDGDKNSNLGDGDTIEEAKPKSNIKFDFVIKNLFDEDEDDIEIENIFITVTIKEIDDDDDLEEETKEFNLDAEEKSSTQSVKFDLPTAVDEGSYDVEIVVEGEEAKSPYTEHRVEWTLTLDVEKEKHDMDLERAEFDQITLSCDRETTFYVELVNFGSSDEDELILTIENSALGINIKQEDIEIDEGDDWSKSYPITVADDVAPGTYKVITKMYYDSSDYNDKDFELNAYGSTDLVISKCVVTTPAEEEEEVIPEEEEEVIVEPVTEEETTLPTGQITREVSFQDTSLYLILLVATVVILGLILLVLFFKLLSK